MTKDTALDGESTKQRGRAGRSTQARGIARRRAILDTAMSLFSVGGFNTVSLADIANEVGITQAGILHYFPTKAALLLAVLQEREARNVVSRKERQEHGESPLAAYVETLAENDRNPELVQLFVILAAESTAEGHAGHEWFVQRNIDLMKTMIGLVQETVDESKLPDGIDAEVVARWMLGLAHGLGAQWVFDTSAFARAEHVRLFLRLLEPYMRP
ncbi:TetR family transcriptional regulator [Kribbella sp. VKM Ac-2569]|uniref:TetR/AcrR family transcriptional regulator n=1 Tax=Kribbella sp. VKM Ac-2569 TaxID=2512220 RepID=UPI00102C138E|nr:TetR/AcrR family transcriptional regulator [Kribbella sp. VKM Ac-2569]RZT27511.1 TetR family transcriptional regulator [Kribbella sp. VKM Ac-2569]